MTLLAWLAGPAAAEVVCPTCAHTRLQAVVDATPPGGVAFVFLGGGVYDEPVVVDGGRTLAVVVIPGEIATFTASAPAEAVFTVRDGARLELTGLTVLGDSRRAVDASGGASVATLLTVFVGEGLTGGDGALVRLVDASFEGVATGFDGGYAVGDGGQLAAIDSDVTCDLCSFTAGTANRGGAIAAVSTGAPRAVSLEGSVLLDGNSYGDGGLVAVEGPVRFEMTLGQLTDGSAIQGGLLMVAPGAEVVLTDVDLSHGTGFFAGGGIAMSGGRLVLEQSFVRESEAPLGGGIVVLEDAADAEIELLGSGVQANVALTDGGGMWIGAGAVSLVDTVLAGNGAFSVGGGLYVAPEATVSLLRSTLCQNVAWLGGGAALRSAADLFWRNSRVIDNHAADDGGGVLHEGAGALLLAQVHLLGNTSSVAGGAAVSAWSDLHLDGTLVGWSEGGIAVRVDGGAEVTRAETAWWQNAAGHLAGLNPEDPTAVFEDPRLVRYVPGDDCATQQDWQRWTSPLRDRGAAAPERSDPDGTRADLGAYGGPSASPDLWGSDLDADGTAAIHDCDDEDPTFGPGAADAPYDGIDQDCDGGDDFDGDQDGERAVDYGGADCDDADPAVRPGADETAAHTAAGIDADCDGRLDADADGWEVPADCDDDDPAVHPAALDDDPRRDLDCNGFADDPRPLAPVGCAHAPGALAGALGLLATRRRRRSRW